MSGMSVGRFVEKYDIPKNFGILSIDAEGQGNKVYFVMIRNTNKINRQLQTFLNGVILTYYG